jgi:D-beta-D-heptose 7-phosphate kinase/D-beta-D-heptose 1-phosphate adenosyltransferase
MISNPHERLIATLAYADIFDYPLTGDELRLWSIGRGVISDTDTENVEHIEEKGTTYYVLRGRKRIVGIRAIRRQIAGAKWKAIRLVSTWFAWIPTVLLVGVTGGLSMDNAGEYDDIDIFIITSSGTLWSTRLAVTLISDITGIRRKPDETHVANKVCLNMFMGSDTMALPKKERDVFAAHEVLQMVPLWQRADTYRKFLQANKWVEEYLPYAWKEKIRYDVPVIKRHEIPVFSALTSFLLHVAEPMATLVQLWYMQRHRTTEIITGGLLRFHPNDARIWVKKKYSQRLQKYNIPIDKFFYHR